MTKEELKEVEKELLELAREVTNKLRNCINEIDEVLIRSEINSEFSDDDVINLTKVFAKTVGGLEVVKMLGNKFMIEFIAARDIMPKMLMELANQMQKNKENEQSKL